MSDPSGKKIPFINLSLFTNLSESISSDHGSKPPNSSSPMEFNLKAQVKSPRNYFQGDVVGLGIVAAMNESNDTHEAFYSSKGGRNPKIALSPRSLPIPIVSAKPFSKFSGSVSEMDEMELSESYTCVIAHFGNDSIKKREYFDDKPQVTVTAAAAAVGGGGNWGNSQVHPASSPPIYAGAVGTGTAFQAANFLKSCYLCKKKLHGLDIFMYRGDKAFCSSECRLKQILNDEHNEKRVSGTLMSFDYSASPCSASGFYPAGVAAA